MYPTQGYVCVCVCVCVCIYVCVFVCVYVCMCVSLALQHNGCNVMDLLLASGDALELPDVLERLRITEALTDTAHHKSLLVARLVPRVP